MLVEAGEIALRWFRSDVEAEDKGGDRGYDPVTIADRDIEQLLRERITAAYPDHEVVGEEAGSSGPPGRYRWLLDPIDGTKAFVTGSPLWGTLVGLLDDGLPVAGWIHQPYLEETFVGIAGRGAWMERRGSRHPLRTRQGVGLDDAVVYCTTPTMFTDPDERALFEAVQPPRPPCALRRRLLRLRPAGIGPRRCRDRHRAAALRHRRPDGRDRSRRRRRVGGAGRRRRGGGFVVAAGSASSPTRVVAIRDPAYPARGR